MSEFRRRLMMQAESDPIIRLPYVESTGEQCIDTLYKPNPSTGFDLHISLLRRLGNSSLSGATSPFGVSEGDYSLAFNHGSVGGDEFYLWSAKAYAAGGQSYMIGSIKQKLDLNPHVAYVMNEQGNALIANVGDASKVIPKNTHTYDTSIFVLGRQKKGQFDNPYKIYATRLYGLKIYEDNVIVRDYIPAMKDGVCGLYEEMKGTWHPSFTGVDLLPPTE